MTEGNDIPLSISIRESASEAGEIELTITYPERVVILSGAREGLRYSWNMVDGVMSVNLAVEGFDLAGILVTDG